MRTWTGAGWNAQVNMTTGVGGAYTYYARGFDIAWERLSDSCMIAFTIANNTTPYYRLWTSVSNYHQR